MTDLETRASNAPDNEADTKALSLIPLGIYCLTVGLVVGMMIGHGIAQDIALRNNGAHYFISDDGQAHFAWGPKQ